MNEISKRAEDLLADILTHRDEKGACESDYWRERFDSISSVEDALLRSLFQELIRNNMISVMWADNYPYIINLLGKGVSYFEDKTNLETQSRTGTYINNFYGSADNVHIQQGTINSTQKNFSAGKIDEGRIKELIELIKKYDPMLDSEYGKEAASEVRKAADDLSEAVSEENDISKIKKVLAYLRDLSVNASGGLIASGIIQLVEMILR